MPLSDILSPGGVYRSSLRRAGHTVVVRAPDGIHLSAAGTSLAADEVARVLATIPGVLARRP